MELFSYLFDTIYSMLDLFFSNIGILENYIIDFIDLELIKVVFFTTICGIVFGFERTKRNKSIGIRTSIFVCLGAGIFAYLGTIIPGVNDNSRVIAQIVSGIGFIGAGVIFKSNTKERMIGITTASLLWVLAAIGIMVGLGKGIQATFITLIIYFINIIFIPVEELSYKRARIQREKKLKQKQIKLCEDSYNKALKGEINATIKRGIYKIATGEKVLVNLNNLSEKQNILVRKIEHSKYINIDFKIIKKLGFESKEDFNIYMENKYKTISEEDSMTIVYFELK